MVVPLLVSLPPCEAVTEQDLPVGLVYEEQDYVNFYETKYED